MSGSRAPSHLFPGAVTVALTALAVGARTPSLRAGQAVDGSVRKFVIAEHDPGVSIR